MINLLESSDLKQIINLSNKNSKIIAVILFGSYAKGIQKETSDLDLCIIRKENTHNIDFLKILEYKDKIYDIHFLDRLPDYIQFRIFSEGKILLLKDEEYYFKLRKKVLHVYRAEYPFKQRRLQKMIEAI